MRPYDREIDSHDDELVRRSVLGLMPAVTWQEMACLRHLAQRSFWLQPIDSPSFDYWQLEQLDRRVWIEAREVDLASKPEEEDHPRYEPRGPGFSPLHNHRTSGRPDWPSICTSFQWASPKPTGWFNRLNTTIRLTPRGRGVAERVSMEDLGEVGLFDDTAYQLQRISAGWRGRDNHVLRLLAIGVKTSQTHYEHEVRDRAMRSVSAAVGRLQDELIPKLALEVDPGLRDELRSLARDLDPHAEVPDPDDDDLTHRWRLSWHEVRCEDRIGEIVPLLFGMQQRTPGTFADLARGDEECGARSIEEIQSPWTVKLLCRAISRGETKVREWRKAATPPIPRRTRGKGFSEDELRLLSAVARRGGDPDAANAILAVIGTLPS